MSWGLKSLTFSQWPWNGSDLKPLKLGGRILCRIEDIASFEQQQFRKKQLPTRGDNKCTQLFS
ncbi:MAG: DNA-binding protein [Alphaproteobacteria bacterium]|nr:DNA-binding protein [Alphaproteobacteria bacterium]